MVDIGGLDIAEQAALGSGAEFWTTKAVGEIPPILLTDGPHGVRKQSGTTGDHIGLGASEPATCFPPAVALSQTWDPALIERIGAALGEECLTLGVGVLLGPGVNIKRDPRCGRNFEYYSEDPLLAGVFGAAWVRGIQGRGVGASVKHFAANNAEFDRMRASSDVDDRTLREIYLRAFEYIVREAGPWTVMCSYNRINGVFAAENRWLLTDVLRDEWGFDGVVVSDWGAVRDRVAAVAAGLDLEMPGTGGVTDGEVVSAVESGRLAPDVVTRAAQRVATLAQRVRLTGPGTFDIDAHHALAREAAGRAIVLLKNDDGLLPLQPSRLAIVGSFAVEPRFQGGGSSQVEPTRLDIPLHEIRRLAEGHDVTYCADTEDLSAVAAADAAVVFLGLSAPDESEGFDRSDIDLPAAQIELLRRVVQVQPRTVVVLAHGGVVRLHDIAGIAPAILDGALLGQAGGGAIADVLFGAVNPSGRLAETVPVRLQDAPAYLNFPSERGHTRYGERIFVGYRWYDAKDLPVTYPFGHGLSYTTFAYDNLDVRDDHGGLTVTVGVTNTGARRGREVVQIYAGLADSQVARAPRWLVGFGAVTLEPGDRNVVEIAVRRNDLAYWADRWVVETGDYTLWAGASCRDLRLRHVVTVSGDEEPGLFTRETTLGELLAHPRAAAVIASAMGGMADETHAMSPELLAIIAATPVDRLVAFSGGLFTRDRLDRLLDELNDRS